MKRIIPLALALVAAFSAPAHAGSGLESPDSRGRVVTTCSKTADGGTVCQDKQREATCTVTTTPVAEICTTTAGDGGHGAGWDDLPPLADGCEYVYNCSGDVCFKLMTTGVAPSPPTCSSTATQTGKTCYAGSGDQSYTPTQSSPTPDAGPSDAAVVTAIAPTGTPCLRFYRRCCQ